MAKAYASRILEAPVEAVWAVVRDFNALPSWLPVISCSSVEDGLASDVVGCVRSFYLGDQHIRERLLMLDDSRYRFSYNFETPAFPVRNYIAQFDLIPVTNGDHTFAQWRATFDEAPEDTGKYEQIVSRDVFAAGLQALASKVTAGTAPEGAIRWQGYRPAKVFCSSLINGPIDRVWARIRDFAGMDDWHPDITRMSMLDGARPDQVSGVRDFFFGPGRLHEQLTMLCDRTCSFRYKINRSEMPWLNYHAGAQFFPVTDTNKTFAVWTADWVASPTDDLSLIPTVHKDVFQKAFDTLNERYFAD